MTFYGKLPNLPKPIITMTKPYTSCDKFLSKHKAAFSPNHNLNIKRQTPDTLLSDKVVLNTAPAGTGTLTKYTLIKYSLKLV